jgi:hypothetical protein
MGIAGTEIYLFYCSRCQYVGTVKNGLLRVASPRLTGRTRCFDTFIYCWFCPGWRQAVKFRSGVEPNLRELQVGLSYFVRRGLACPPEALFGHGAVVRGRFH